MDKWLEESRALMPGHGRDHWSLKEDVAGAPGAFASSDGPEPTLEDQVAELLDMVRNPTWEYPQWALPKVALDESGPKGPYGSFKSQKAAEDFYQKVARFYEASKPVVSRRMPGATRWNVELPQSCRAKRGILADLEKEAEKRGGHLLGVG